MLVANDLATAIRTGMGFPTPNSAQLVGWSSGVISHLISAGIVNFAPGTITGSTSPGGSLSSGAGSGGIVSGLSGSAMAPLVASGAGYPGVSSILQIYCNQIAIHIMTGLVTFDPGNVTGSCTSTPLSPGPLVSGAATNGKLNGLSGPTLANLIHSAVGYPGSTSSKLIQFCTAICNYLMANASVTFLTGTVTGVCPPGGGPLSAGAASGGMFS